MTEKLKQTIKEEMVNLPKESQEVINSFGWEKISEEIGKKYLLDEDEITSLQAETILVLMGLAEINEYSSVIENEIGTSKNEAEKITKEVIEKIFNPIANTISKNLETNFKNKDLSWKQTLNFITSGGDYSTFAKEDKKRLL